MAESERRIIIATSSDQEESRPNDKLVAELIYSVADLYIRLDIPYEGFPICAAPIFDFAEQIGTRIRMNRIRRNMTQQRLAILMHMDKSTISRNERGLSLTLEAIPQYAEQLGCTVHDLIPDYDHTVLRELKHSIPGTRQCFAKRCYLLQNVIACMSQQAVTIMGRINRLPLAILVQRWYERCQKE